MNLAPLEAKLGYTFQNNQLAIEALTHKTWIKEQQDHGGSEVADQQRLEFLGDAFLGSVVALHLFKEHPQAQEGELTERKSALVKGKNLHKVGEQLELTTFLRLGIGETQNIHTNKGILEDTIEALLGAILLDGGEDEAREVIHNLILTKEADVVPEKDPIIERNEHYQKQYGASPPAPDYGEPQGPPHAHLWQATLEDGTTGGWFSKKREAYRDACRKFLAAREPLTE